LKHLGEALAGKLCDTLQVEEGDAAALVAADGRTASRALGAVRIQVAGEKGLAPKGLWRPVWIYPFPVFEREGEGEAWAPTHHPFSSPFEEDLHLLERDPGAVRGRTYDLVLNGVELGSGSIRIHDPEVQKRIFAVLGISSEEAEARFGFLLEALRYGAPPHGGIALGYDRVIMLLAGEDSIRQVIAFPKTTSAQCLMTKSPSSVDDAQLEDLGIEVRRKGEPPPDSSSMVD
jgi:aspartyl-tRNA synthetase